MKSGRRALEPVKQKTLCARPYQVEMAEIAKHESVIIKLNTGLGKTFIAVIVIKHHLPETYKPLAEGGRRIVFICKTGKSLLPIVLLFYYVRLIHCLITLPRLLPIGGFQS
ncbi:unnamed protein product [Dibothriocephalus latus]|uniref:Helicase/UvrB N-terminal domain-containing protein n=1 Tax=Dibothriocephalus latus TaxID=60516 RepID=A0A3P7M830_DIBLA|nr:unnamed protein product [Dibothriocephalus latus]